MRIEIRTSRGNLVLRFGREANEWRRQVKAAGQLRAGVLAVESDESE